MSCVLRFPQLSILTAAAAVMVLLGAFGFGHGGWKSTNADMRFLYLAGLQWTKSHNAYQPSTIEIDDPSLIEAVDRYDYAYPPSSAPLCMLLASRTLPAAKWLMTLINIAAAIALAWCAALHLRPQMNSSSVDCRLQCIVAALVMGSLPAAFVIWAGQTALLVAACLHAGWMLAQRQRWVAAGVLLALASIKPHLMALALIWLMLEGRWRAVLVAVVVAIARAAWPIFLLGPIDLLQSWLGAVSRYSEGPYNQLGSRMVFGAQNMLWDFGLKAPNLSGLALIGFGLLWKFRQRFSESETLALLIGVSLLFGFSHSYDLVLLAPLVPVLAQRCTGSRFAAGAGFALWLIVTFPTSQLEGATLGHLAQARVIALAIGLLWVVREILYTTRRETVQP